MKEAVVLVLLAVLLVGGIGIWLANGNSIPLFSSQPAAVQPAADAQAAADAAKAKEAAAAKPVKAPAAKKAKIPTAPAADSASSLGQQPEIVGPVAEVVIAPPAPKQFPSADQIAPGAERENIGERYGQPALTTTTTSDDGRVQETLVYARKSGRDVTVIRIEDGKVLSAYSR
jgi:hypothetical protein